MGVQCEFSAVAETAVREWLDGHFGESRITKMAMLHQCGPALPAVPQRRASKLEHGLHRFWR